MALPTVGTAVSNGETNSDTNDVEITINAGTDTVLFAFSDTADNTETDEVTGVVLDPGGANEQAFTAITDVHASQATENRVNSFRLVDPPTGTFTVRFTANNSMSRFIASVVQVDGVDQTTVTGATGMASGDNATGSVDVTTTAADSLVLGSFIHRRGTNVTPGTDVTEHWDIIQGGYTGWGGTKEAPTTGTYTVDGSVDSADDFVMLGIEILSPAAAGGPEISETDAVTVGDSATVDPVSPTETTQVDAVSLAEAIQMELVSFLAESEAVSVGDQAALELLSFLSELDAVTVGENVVVAVSGPEISASDGITVGENVTVEIPVEGAIDVSVSDAVNTGESASVEVSDPETVQVDAVTVAEAIKMEMLSFIEQSEALTIGEDVVMELVSFIDQLEAVTVGESVSLELLSFIDASEAVTVGEDVTVEVSEEDTISISVSDGVTVGESVTSGPVSDPTLTALDGVTVDDTVTLTGLEPLIDGGDWGPRTRKKVRQKYTTTPIEKVPAREVRMAQEMQRKRQERLEREKQLEEQARKKEEHREKVQLELERMEREEQERKRRRAIALVNLRKAQKKNNE